MNTVHTNLRRLWLVFAVVIFTACTAPAVPEGGALSPTPVPFQPAIGRALAFLARQFDADVGLFHRGPDATGEHWLAPDNLLALRTLQVASADELAAKVEAGIGVHRVPVDTLLAVLDGQAIDWPPHTAVVEELAPGVWQETYAGPGTVEDWQSSNDLALFGALNAWNRGDRAEAERRYAAAMAAFDGAGFKDAALDGRYATHTLALALLVGDRIGMAFDKRLLDALSARQQTNGGFAAHYTASGEVGEADTPTTAYALLALYALR